MKDGNVFNGSIDLLWQTAEGDILIDFKTCPMGRQYILDEKSDHYAGWYAGQLDAYTDALETAGEKVIKRYIYYPVSGLLVEVGRSNVPSSNEDSGVSVSSDDSDIPMPNDVPAPFEKSAETSLSLEMDAEAIAMFKSGEAVHLQLTIDDNNKNDILENIKGHLILVTDEMPMKYHGCYYWNNGVFPYAIKKDLKTIVIYNGIDSCRLRILSHTTSVGERFRFGEPGKPSIPDKNGDSCIWNVIFQVEPIDDNGERIYTKTYLLRWNPTISSFRLDDYRRATSECPNGFGMNWSVFEWEDAQLGDRFFMLRTGDDHAGIVFRGVFTSAPYLDDDWAGKGKQRHYMDMNCFDCVPANQKPSVDVETLENTIPNIDWRRGHSGELLSKENADKLDDMWNNK